MVLMDASASLLIGAMFVLCCPVGDPASRENGGANDAQADASQVSVEDGDRLAKGLQAQRLLSEMDLSIRAHPIDYYADLADLLADAAGAYDVLAQYDRGLLAKKMRGCGDLATYLQRPGFEADVTKVRELIDFVLDQSSKAKYVFGHTSLESSQCFNYRDEGQVFAVSPESPLNGGTGIKSIQQIPVNGGFKVLEVQPTHAGKWYKVAAFDSATEAIWSGWIEASALVGRTPERNFAMEPTKVYPDGVDRPTIAAEAKRQAEKLRLARAIARYDSSNQTRSTRLDAKTREQLTESVKRTATREFLPIVRVAALLSLNDDDNAERYLNRKFASHVAADPSLSSSILATDGLCQVTFTFRQSNCDVEICLTARADGYEHVAVTPLPPQ